jgi:hypothetical protein
MEIYPEDVFKKLQPHVVFFEHIKAALHMHANLPTSAVLLWILKHELLMRGLLKLECWAG